LHFHKKKDETFILRKGEMTLELAGDEIRMEIGKFYHVPLGCQHRIFCQKTGYIDEYSTHDDQADSYRIEKSRKT